MSVVGSVQGGRFDEAASWEPTLRDALVDPTHVERAQLEVDRLLVAEGAGHLVHDLPVRADGRRARIESRPWRLDPIPMVLDAPTFRWLAGAVIERMEALETVLADLYGPRRLLRERVVSPEAVYGSPRYRIAAVGTPPPRRWLSTYAVDVVRTAEGWWHVVQDFTDAPPGLGFALLNRSVRARVGHDAMGSTDVASLARFPGLLRRSLAAAARVESPRTVLFTGGIDHPSYVDHSFLAVQLGVNLVEGADLVVRQRRVWLRTLDGLEQVDVVYRRLEDPAIDPLEVGATGAWGVPGLLLAIRSGGAVLTNAHGAGIIEEPELAATWAAAAEHLTGSSLRLPRLVGMPELAATPVHLEGAGAVHGSATLRLFVAHDGEQAWVLPGGTGRVLAPGDDPRWPTACLAKDVWVLGTTMTPMVAAPLPQVDFGRSVPTRAADAMFWANRAAERAEAMARLVRVISARYEQDPGLVSIDQGRWCDRMSDLAAAVRRGGPLDADFSTPVERLGAELAATSHAVAAEIGSLLTEATTVREFLSTTTGRILERLSRGRASLRRDEAEVDDLDAIIADFAAFAGLWSESTVRGPAWRLGDTGRRIERSLVVLDLLEAAGAGQLDADDPVDAMTIEVLLAANESLVAYRRRHRSEVEPQAAMDLVLRDPSNPRSLAASVERLHRHAADSEWGTGVELADRARLEIHADVVALVPTMRALLHETGAALVARWFAAPVAPIEAKVR